MLVVPFHDEEKNVERFLAHLSLAAGDPRFTYLLGVNHRSHDRSESVFVTFSHPIETVALVHEFADIAAASVPRHRGIAAAVDLAEAQRCAGRKIVIGSIDVDSVVSPEFVNDVRRFSTANRDFLVFPTRYDQRVLVECVLLQRTVKAQTASVTALISVNWLKCHLRYVLLLAGAIETRGSGGYAFTLDGYEKAAGHRPLFSRDGRVLVGESNAVGIRARRASATFEYS